MNTKTIPCSQQELYAVCTLGWENCQQNLPAFQAVKSRYTSEFVAMKKQEVINAMNIPAFNRRSSAQELLRLECLKAHDAALDAWQQLRLYIQDAWKGPEQRLHLKSAGQERYKDARAYNWEAGLMLVNNGLNFINEFKELLMSNNNMTEAFAENYRLLQQAYNEKFNAYMGFAQNSTAFTNAKLDANFRIYSDLIGMFAEAKVIFKRNKDVLKLFTFDHLIRTISGLNPAGIKGLVSNGHPLSEPIPGLEIRLLESEILPEIEEDNSYRFVRLPSGKYTVLVSAMGYLPKRIDGVDVKPGVSSTLNIALESAPPEN